jgi:hypothetical protein
MTVQRLKRGRLDDSTDLAEVFRPLRAFNRELLNLTHDQCCDL